MLASEMDGMSVVGKPWSIGRRVAVAALAFSAIGFLVFAVAGSNGEGRVAGAGSTLVNPILQRVSTSYQGYLAADRVDVIRQEGQSGDWTAGASALDYDPVGSIGGLARLADPTMTFAATEVPLTAQDLTDQRRVQFPLIVGAAAPVVNLDLSGGTLKLNADVLAGIFSGTITTWSDPAIAALNADLALPDLPVSVRYRRDGSGTTWTVTGYLARSAAWTGGQTAQMTDAAGEGADGSRGMVEAVRATPGAIGYAEIGQARRAGLGLVDLIGPDGVSVSASAQTIRTAIAEPGWSPDASIAPPPAAGWPMTATVYVVMQADGDARQTERALNFFRYFYAEAPRQADALGYVALPPATVTAVEAYWASVFTNQS